MEIRLKGWQAVVVLLAIVAFVAFRYTTARATLDTEGAEVLRPLACHRQRAVSHHLGPRLAGRHGGAGGDRAERGASTRYAVRALLPDGVLDRDGLAPPGGRDGAFLLSRLLLRSRWGRMDGQTLPPIGTRVIWQSNEFRDRPPRRSTRQPSIRPSVYPSLQFSTSLRNHTNNDAVVERRRPLWSYVPHG